MRINLSLKDHNGSPMMIPVEIKGIAGPVVAYVRGELSNRVACSNHCGRFGYGQTILASEGEESFRWIYANVPDSPIREKFLEAARFRSINFSDLMDNQRNRIKLIAWKKRNPKFKETEKPVITFQRKLT